MGDDATTKDRAGDRTITLTGRHLLGAFVAIACIWRIARSPRRRARAGSAPGGD